MRRSLRSANPLTLLSHVTTPYYIWSNSCQFLEDPEHLKRLPSGLKLRLILRTVSYVHQLLSLTQELFSTALLYKSKYSRF